MRAISIVIGLILIVAGVAIWLGQVQYPHEKDVVQIGKLSASVTQERNVPQWLGALAVIGGVGLVAAAALRKP